MARISSVFASLCLVAGIGGMGSPAWAARPRDAAPPELHLIPYPKEIRHVGDPVLLPLNAPMIVVGAAEVPHGAEVLADELSSRFGVTITPSLEESTPRRRPQQRAITLLLCSSKTGAAWLAANEWNMFPPRAGQPESYAFMARDNALVIAARREQGFLYAALTLLQMIEPHRDRRGNRDGVEVPGVMVRDWPALRRRGLMLDPARLKERTKYYGAVADFMARRKANTLFLHLTDDQGVALEFPSHPSLASPHAFTVAEMKALVAQGQRLGLEIVPEIESLGHAGAITSNPKYKDLSEAGSNCLNPCHPGTRKLLADLYSDCADIFPSEFVHCGLGEVSTLGKSPECRKAYEAAPDKDDTSIQEWAYARHAAAIRDMLAGRGKRMIMWGDMIRRHPGVAELLSKDIVIDDADYGESVAPASVEFFTALGFEVIGSPALMCGDYRVMPSALNLANLENFARIAQRRGLLGLNVTVWAPQRYIADAAWLPFARAAAVMWEGLSDAGGSFDEERFLSAYCHRRFGVDADDELIAALRTLQELVPSQPQLTALLPPNADALRQLIETGELPPATEGVARLLHDEPPRIVKTLEAWRGKVQRNPEEFEALLLVARIERQLGAMLDLAVNEVPVPLEGDDRTNFERRIMDGRILLQGLDTAWDRWRYDDMPGRVGPPASLEGDWLNQCFIRFDAAAREILDARN